MFYQKLKNNEFSLIIIEFKTYLYIILFDPYKKKLRKSGEKIHPIYERKSKPSHLSKAWFMLFPWLIDIFLMSFPHQVLHTLQDTIEVSDLRRVFFF